MVVTVNSFPPPPPSGEGPVDGAAGGRPQGPAGHRVHGEGEECGGGEDHGQPEAGRFRAQDDQHAKSEFYFLQIILEAFYL